MSFFYFLFLFPGLVAQSEEHTPITSVIPCFQMNALAYIRMVETTVLDESHVYIESLILEVFNTPSELMNNFSGFPDEVF